MTERDYQHAEQRPSAPRPRGPDFLIEGRWFDHLAPTSASARTIAYAMKKKVDQGQVRRIVVNLDDSDVATAELRQQLQTYPVPGLEEVIAIRNGAVLHLFP